MNRTPFILSHHPPEQYDRCVGLGPWMVCSRCLGLYPLLLALLGAQIAAEAPADWWGDPWVASLAPLPALFDWARGRFDPRTGSNRGRLLTGALLALGLARTLYLHILEPFNLIASLQFAGVALVAFAVEAAVRLRGRQPTDPNAPPDVEPGEGTDFEG